jgi:pimeloyl-ACP methyl ester carboxylesterase
MHLFRETPEGVYQTVKVKDAELRYSIMGKGKPVLCIHGTTLSDMIVGPLQLYPKLFEDYQFITYYRAGYNGSILEKDSLTMEEGAFHIKQLLDHLGIKKAHVISYSLGGIIGFQFMLDYPEYVESSVLLEPWLTRRSDAAIKALTVLFTKAFELYNSGKKYEAALFYIEGICGTPFMSTVDMTMPMDALDRLHHTIDASFLIDVPAASNWSFNMEDALNMFDRPTMPVLAVMGMDSESIIPGFRETQKFLMDFFPQAKRCGILGATHGLMVLNPLAVGEAIHSFLKSVDN